MHLCVFRYQAGGREVTQHSESPPGFFQDTFQEPGEDGQEDHRPAVCDQEEVRPSHLGEQEQLPVRTG